MKKKVISMLRGPESQTICVNGWLGRDRARAIIAIYRMQVEGWSLERAEAETRSFGFDNEIHKLKKTVRNFAAKKGK